MTVGNTILVLNCGSSSVKYALFSTAGALARLQSGALERVGMPEARFRARDSSGKVLFDEQRDIPDHEAALDLLLARIAEEMPTDALTAAGHRVVHGGPDCDCPEPVTPALEDRLTRLIPLVPLHLPANLAGIAAINARRPDLPQVACFDTAFHHGLPRRARMTGLPREFEGQGIRRYGFHGLSYEFVVEDLQRREGLAATRGRLVVAHLGNGASMAALRDGRSVETTMGFSALAGLPMGTRCGDLDPGIVLHLLGEGGMRLEAVRALLYEGSGLLGISGVSGDMEDLLDQEHLPQVAEAIDFFCYRARAHLAALTAALGGVDRLVFTGGIGANSPIIRERICAGLSYLGIEIDSRRNRAGERTISAGRGAVTVQAFPTDEETMIARHTQRLVSTRLVAQEA